MIRLAGIERTFIVGEEAVHALRGVNLEIAQGEYLSIMGPSGSGKSTLLNVIGLLDRPSAGTYELDRRDVTGLGDDELARARREKIGFVFQFFHLVPRLTALENVELPMVFAGVDPAERRERAMGRLRGVGLEPRASHRPDQLSGGERQRVAIARALANDPRLVLADEPTGSLDSKTGLQIVELLRRARDERGTSILMVTNDDLVAGHADRALRMRDGRVEDVIRAAAPVSA
jgi:putative ABC transport system ATP-binding protein